MDGDRSDLGLGSDAMLAEEAEQVHDVAPEIDVDPGVGDAEVRSQFSLKLANCCLDLRTYRLPDQSASDYESNDGDLWRLLSLDLAQADEIDVKLRCRAGLHVMSPQKLARYSPAIQLWGAEVRQLFEKAKAEALRRLPRRRQGANDSQQRFNIGHQEVPERFQNFLLGTFQPALLVANATDMRYEVVPSPSHAVKVLGATEATAFFETLFDFTTVPKTPLQDLLCKSLGSSVQGKTCLITITRFPPSFPEWLMDQMIAMRAAGVELKLVLVFFLTRCLPPGRNLVSYAIPQCRARCWTGSGYKSTASTPAPWSF